MRSLFIVCIIYQVLIFSGTLSELYTSVDELSRWPRTTEQFSSALNDLISAEEHKLSRIRELRDKLRETMRNNLMIDIGPTNRNESGSASVESLTQNGSIHHNQYPSARQMQNPVLAFVTMNRLVRAIDDLYNLLEEQVGDQTGDDDLESSEVNRPSHMSKLMKDFRQNLPANDDLTGTGEALLRLQIFYDLDIDDLIRGSIRVPNERQEADKENLEIADELNAHQHSMRKVIIMKSMDCFELGRIAFQDEQYALAIQWLYKALELCTSSEDQESTFDQSIDESFNGGMDRNDLINNVLEYMAYSAYKLNLIRYSAKLTRVWLDRDPNNERAIDNLQYYSEELEADMDEKSLSESPVNGDGNELDGYKAAQDFVIEATEAAAALNMAGHLNDLNSGAPSEEFTVENYSITDDQMVRDLCRRQESAISPPKNDLNCQHKYLGYKVEVLNQEPKIIRVHDIISESEADHLMKTSIDKLQRSTIHLGAGGQQVSHFRIAKTAWISGKADSIAKKIEDRLEKLLGISMLDSEDLQIVNYGLGGFYGPHLDSARSTSSMNDTDSRVDVSDLRRNDRYATILVYLNHVQAGGSTVFPKLNLSVEPIERSAVVWYNLREDGLSDKRTLHTGCPVLLGSKWIATKWPREMGNILNRQCKRRRVSQSSS